MPDVDVVTVVFAAVFDLAVGGLQPLKLVAVNVPKRQAPQMKVKAESC